MVAEANYGGRVTDPKDRRLIKIILEDFYNTKIITEENYKFSSDGIYYSPPEGDLDSYIKFI
jgi:dynein heavy chain